MHTDYEASFLRMVDKICNGCRIDINHTGTRVAFTPGQLFGGKFDHDCSPSRCIGYFLEALIWLAPFAKKPIVVVLRGITNDERDPSPDILRTVILPLLKCFGLEEGVELKVGAVLGGTKYPVRAAPLVRVNAQVTVKNAIRKTRRA